MDKETLSLYGIDDNLGTLMILHISLQKRMLWVFFRIASPVRF